MFKKLTMMAIFFLLTACASSPPKETLTVDHFIQTITVNDDPLNPEVAYSTRNGNNEANILGPLTGDSVDPFMIAVVDKKNRSVEYAVATVLQYPAKDWRFYQQANYSSPEGPKRVNLEIFDRNVDCSALSSLKNCFFEEIVVFEIPQSTLKSIVSVSKSKNLALWDFKVVGKQYEHRLQMPIAEIEAILQVGMKI